MAFEFENIGQDILEIYDELQSWYGEHPDETVALELVRAGARERSRQARNRWRLRCRATIQQKCPMCKKKFWVVLHRKPGRIRQFCGVKCADLHRQHKFRHGITVTPIGEDSLTS